MRMFRILAALCALILALTLGASAIADAGDFAGDSDWGGSDWGGSDWGGSDNGGSDWGGSNYGGSDYGGSYWDGSDLGGYFWGGSTIGGGITMLVVFVVVLLIQRSRRGNAAKPQNLYQAAEDDGPGLPLDILRQKDPLFNEQAFLEKAGNNYVRMQNAWQSGDWTPMRAIMTDALYQQMGRQLDELKRAGLTNHVDRIAVLNASIRRYAQEGDNDVLVVRLATRICDYTTNNQTGQLVRGDPKKELFMTYDWKLIRQKDRRTQAQAGMTAVSCPNCGAPLEINHTGQCPYCSTVVTLQDHDWALSQIRGISQRSA